MAQTVKSVILSKFEAGDRPTDQDFLNLFDSILFIGNVGNHDNGLGSANTSIQGNFTIGGNLAVNGTGTLTLPGKVAFGINEGDETIASGLHVYNSNTEPVIYISGSVSNTMFSGISGDATSSIQLADPTNNVNFGTHTGKAFISVAGHEYFNITGSNLGPHSFFSGSVGIGSVANTNAAEKFKILDADTNVTAHLQTNKTDGVASIGFQNDAQTYTFGVRGNDNLTIVNAAETPFKIKSNATTDNLVLDGGKVGIGTSSPANTLDVRGDVVLSNGTDNAITLFNNDSVASGPDILFHESGLIAAEGNIHLNINSDGGSADFSIRTGGDTNAADEIFKITSAGQVSSSGGFIGDGSGLTGITGGQLTGFVTSPGDNRLITSNTAGDAVIGEANLTFNGTNLEVGSGGKIKLTSESESSGSILVLASDAEAILSTENDSAVNDPIQFVLKHNFGATELINRRGNLVLSASGHIFTSNNLGVGTSSPSQKLHVKGSDHTAIQVDSSGGTDKNAFIKLTNDAQSFSLKTIGSNDNLYIVNETAGTNPLKITADATNNNLVVRNGKVGIGTDNPSYKLDVVDTISDVFLRLQTDKTDGAAAVRFKNDVQEYTAGITSADLFVVYDATAATVPFKIQPATPANTLVVNSTGIGIGTSSPDAKLDIVGNVKIKSGVTDVITFNNTDDSSTAPDVLFNGNGLISAKDGISIGLNQDGGTSNFRIRTGDPQLGGIGNSNMATIATFATGSVGSGLILHGDGSTKPGQLYFGDQENLNTTGSDAARIKFTSTNSEGNHYISATSDFLVFEKLDSDQVNPDGGILFTNNGGSAGSSPETVSMVIRGNGDIGIGTISPSQKLDINNGHIQLSSGYGIGTLIGNATDEHIIYPYLTSMPTSFTNITAQGTIGANGISIQADQTVNFIETDDNTLVGHMNLNQKVFDWDGKINAQYFYGDGSNLTNLDPAQLSLFINNDGNNRILTAEGDSTINAESNLVFNSTGLGVGTSAPDAILHVKKAAATTGTTNLLVLDGFNDSDISTTPRAIALEFRGGDANSDASGSIRLAYVNDTDFGDDDEGAGNLIFATTNANVMSDKMIITGDGRVGIGVVNPDVAAGGLNIKSANNTTALKVEAGNSSRYLFKGNVTSGYTATFNMDDNGMTMGHSSNIRNLDLHTNDTARIRIKGDGKVGISDEGAFTPSYPLHVKSNNDSPLFVESMDSFAGIRIADSDTTTNFNGIFVDENVLGLRTDNTTALQINSNQEVGIGGAALSSYELAVQNSSNNADLLLRSRGGNGEAYFQADCNANTDASGMLMRANNVIKGFVGYYDGGTRIGTGTGPSNLKGIYIKSGSAANGVVGINTITPNTTYATLEIKQLSAFRGFVIENDDTTDFWNNWYGHGSSDVTFGSSANQLIWSHNGAGQNGGWIQATTNGVNQMFTGQHRNIPATGEVTDYMTKIGYIVSSNGTIQNVPSEEISTHEIYRPNINESLPQVKLSDVPNDKKVYGVISDLEDPESSGRSFMHGNWGSMMEKPEGDDRLVINSVGEGAIMVCDINGNLENGDYITTSEIPGIGMKQNDDLLHNYTVAKIIQDCDFTNNEQYMISTITHNGVTYKTALVGCTYHCG